MGFLDFFRDLKKNEHINKIEAAELKLENLDKLIDPWANTIIENTNSKLISAKDKIIAEKNRILDNITKLNDAELKNTNIPEKTKQIIEGNRKIYIKRANAFLEEINLPNNFNETLEFCYSFDKLLNDFDRKNVKSCGIMQECFLNEANALIGNIKNLDYLIMNDFKKNIEDSEINKVNNLKKIIEETKQKIKQKEELDNKIKSGKEGLEKINISIENKENIIKGIKSGEKYKKYIVVTDKKEKLEREISAVKLRQFDTFSEIKPALNKFERLTMEDKLIKKYTDNYLNALLEDTELKIIEQLHKMRDLINKNELELKDKKKYRILKELESINKENIKEFLDNYNELNKSLLCITSEIEGLSVLNELEELENNIRIENEQLKKDQDNVRVMIDEINKIDVKCLKDNLCNKINSAVGTRIIIL